MSDPGQTGALAASVWWEAINWKLAASSSGAYDNSLCIATSSDDWARCGHCRDEVRRINVEIGRREMGYEWQEPPFTKDAVLP